MQTLQVIFAAELTGLLAPSDPRTYSGTFEVQSSFEVHCAINLIILNKLFKQFAVQSQIVSLKKRPFLDYIKIKRNVNLANHVALMSMPPAWLVSFTQNIILSAEFGPVKIVKRVNRLHLSSLSCHKDCFTSAALLVPCHIICPITSSWLKKLQQKTSKNIESGAEITICAQNWTPYAAQYGPLSNFFHSLQSMETLKAAHYHSGDEEWRFLELRLKCSCFTPVKWWITFYPVIKNGQKKWIAVLMFARLWSQAVAKHMSYMSQYLIH